MFSDLFWALYWIDVLSRVQVLLIPPIVAFIVAWLAVLIQRDSCTHYDGRMKQGRVLWTFAKVVWPTVLGILIGVLLFLTPSKQTMYMMLGVKTTEHIVDSPIGKKLQAIVDAEVDSYFEKVKKK